MAALLVSVSGNDKGQAITVTWPLCVIFCTTPVSRQPRTIA